MTRPTPQQLETFNEIPTSVPGLAFVVLRWYGPWALPVIFLCIVWWSGEKKAERWETMTTSFIKANNDTAAAMKELAEQWRTSHAKVEDMKLTIHADSECLRRIEANTNRRQ